MKGGEKTHNVVCCEEEKSPERSGDFSFYIKRFFNLDYF
ncbi:unnamed protein product, partial [marine sediment metagenome]